MGILDKLKQGAKDVTGIGLNATEQYNRAFQKGIFLQPPNYVAAIENFEKSAEKFTTEGTTEMASRARANAALYRFVSKPSADALAATSSALAEIPEIERVGSQQEMIPTEPLVIELQALNKERDAVSADTHEAKSATYKAAADLFLKIGNAELQFASLLHLDGPTDRSSRRAYYYMALADFHAAQSVLYETPERAHDHIQRAATLFRQAQVTDWALQMNGLLEDVRSKRHCWMCGREMQGRNIFYKHYPSRIERYIRQLVVDRKEDPGMLDGDNQVTLCMACGTAIELQADHYATLRAQEVRDWVSPILDSHEDSLNEHARVLNRHAEAINECVSRINSLASALSR